MRFTTRILLLSVSLAAALADAHANNIPQVQHVIVVIQENRTPDNLFGSDAFTSPHQLQGADLAQTGQCYQANPHVIQLQPLNLGNKCDPDHGHGSWKGTYHGGFMDGACTVKTYNTCPNIANPQYTYAQSSDVCRTLTSLNSMATRITSSKPTRDRVFPRINS
jgi:phospholipase C